MAESTGSRYQQRELTADRHGSALELDRSFRVPLVAYFMKRVNSRNEAEDLTQEVFIRLFNHPDKNNGETIEGYVFTIAANLLRDRAKSAATVYRSRSRSFEVLDGRDVLAASLIEDRNPERVLVARQTIQDVLEALSELGERTRDVFILARLENLQHREIARTYGISVSAVEKMLMKAMAHLGARFLGP